MKEQKVPPPNLVVVRQQIERLKQELEAWETLEQKLLAIEAGESPLGLARVREN